MKLPFTLERKLTLILITFFLSMLLVVVILLHSLLNEYDNRVYEANNANMRNNLSRADSAFSEAIILGDLFVSDRAFQTTLAEFKDTNDEAVKSDVKGDVIARLSNMLDASEHIVDITILAGNDIIDFGDGLGLSSASMSEAATLARAAEGASVWLGSNEGSIYLVRVIRRLEFLSLDELGILFIRIDAGALADSLRQDTAGDGMKLLLANGDRLLYSEFPADTVPEDGVIFSEIDGVPCFIYRGTLPRSGFSYIDAVPKNALFNGVMTEVFAAFVFLLVMLVAFLLILHHIVRRMIERINALKEKMDAFERGQNFSEISTLPGSDEIAQLNVQFDSMAKGYKEVVEDNYQRQLMMKDSAIKMLTQQINPHFLYNVLDSIYWLSQEYNADDIASMSYSLASLFRAAVSAEDLVTIKKELELLESFLGIQRSRFPERISYKVDADESVLSVMLPKFSLQPLVENAVKHSVEEAGVKTEIVVSCHETAEGVLLSVANTGSAFPDDLAEKLKEGRVASSSERIGLQNIDERLHLLFGEGYGLKFRNENGFAIVSFTVPGREDAHSNPC